MDDTLNEDGMVEIAIFSDDGEPFCTFELTPEQYFSIEQIAEKSGMDVRDVIKLAVLESAEEVLRAHEEEEGQE